MTARQTFEAVTGSDRISTLGGGADIIFRDRAFLRVTFEHASTTGMRGVFAPDGTFVPNGISELVTMTPLHIGGGWRFVPTRSKAPRTPVSPGRSTSQGRPALAKSPAVTPYLGGAIVILRFSERSSVLDVENTSTTFHGFAGFGGIDVRLTSVLAFGVEGEYLTVPNAIGQSASSVGTDLGETNVGGLIVRVMFGVRFGR